MSALPSVGTTLPRIVIDAVTIDTVRAFAAVQRDHNPIHLSQNAARTAGFDAPIVHGAYVYCQFERLVRTFGHGQLTSLYCRFVRPLLVGQGLQLTGRVVSLQGEEAVLRLMATATDDTPLAMGEARISRR